VNETKALIDKEQTWFWLGAGGLSLAIFLFLFTWPPKNPSQGMEHEHMSMSMPMAPEMSPAMQTKLLADKKESEFNHHLAGFFVVLAGVFLLVQSTIVKWWPPVKYAWPVCFLLCGTFVLVWSDTELWPFAHRGWLDALRHNPEVLQHKTFAVLLLALGVTEWQRARGVLKAAWSGWIFPALTIGGSVLLLFHHHEGTMYGPNHMELMARVQSEHLSYAVAGISLGLVKGMAEVKTRFHRGFGKVWPLLMIVLGVLVMSYRE
jgi:copper resistance protein D